MTLNLSQEIVCESCKIASVFVTRLLIAIFVFCSPSPSLSLSLSLYRRVLAAQALAQALVKL